MAITNYDKVRLRLRLNQFTAGDCVFVRFERSRLRLSQLSLVNPVIADIPGFGRRRRRFFRGGIIRKNALERSEHGALSLGTKKNGVVLQIEFQHDLSGERFVL